jgi:SpoVK/Ycf46/Vps4 family AAA+-type ATPase
VVSLVVGPDASRRDAAARTIAEASGLPLLRVDLKSVLTKYIGETEHNVARLFDRAEQDGLALFFDEAEALFGRRTDVQDSRDHFGNVATTYLLERLERYDGLVILAANGNEDLDPALLRRVGSTLRVPASRGHARPLERLFSATVEVTRPSSQRH